MSIADATIEQLLVAVAKPRAEEDSPERKAAWQEIKRRAAPEAAAAAAPQEILALARRIKAKYPEWVDRDIAEHALVRLAEWVEQHESALRVVPRESGQE